MCWSVEAIFLLKGGFFLIFQVLFSTLFQLPPLRFPVSEDGIETRGQIRSPWLGTIVDSGIELSYRPASLYSLSGRYDNPMPESTVSLQSGTRNLASILLRLWHWQSDAPTTRLDLIHKVIFLTSFSSFLTFHRSYSTGTVCDLIVW